MFFQMKCQDDPPRREMEFSIELVPGARPTSIALYLMALKVLAEQKKHT